VDEGSRLRQKEMEECQDLMVRIKKEQLKKRKNNND